jgi:CDGSH-type Zn-finger protein
LIRHKPGRRTPAFSPQAYWSQYGRTQDREKSSYILQLEPGVYWWCACGKSASQPYCDGSHKGSDFSPANKIHPAFTLLMLFSNITMSKKKGAARAPVWRNNLEDYKL